jgi:hypothetical protein
VINVRAVLKIAYGITNLVITISITLSTLQEALCKKCVLSAILENGALFCIDSEQ